MRLAILLIFLLPFPAEGTDPAIRRFKEGLAFERAGLLEEAALAFQEAIRFDPTNPEPYTRLRAIYGRKGFDELIRELEAEKARDKEDFINRNLLGVLYARKRLWSKALAELETAVRIEPRDVDALTNLGWVLTELKRYEEARHRFEEALRVNPNYARARAGLGGIYAEADRNYQAAVAEYLRALATEPENATYLSDLAWVYYRSGLFDQAIEALERAVTLEPRSVKAHANLGWAYLKKGEVKKAETHFRKAVALNPRFSFARFGLARAFEALGREEEAAAEYWKAWRQSGNDLYLLYLSGIYLRRYFWIAIGISALALIGLFAFLIRSFRKAMKVGPL